MEWPPSQPAGMRRACVPSWGWMCRDAPSFMERVRNRSPSRPAGSECFCLRPSCPAPGPWPLLAQLNSHLLWLLLASSPPCFLHSYYRLPKLLVLSSLNWFSAKPLFVPLLRPLWTVPGASAPPPPAQPRAPPPPLRPAPPRPSAAARTCCGSSASLLLRRPTLRLAPWLSSPRLPSDFAGLCFFFPPPVSYCACGEGGRGAGASWRDGAGFLLPGPLLSLLAHPFVSFSGLSCRSPSTPPCRSCFVGFSPVSGSSSLSFFPYFFFFFSSPSFLFSLSLTSHLSLGFFESLSLGLCTVLRVPVLNQKQKESYPCPPPRGPYQHPISSDFGVTGLFGRICKVEARVAQGE